MSEEKYRMPAYFEVLDNGKLGYVPTERCLQDQELQGRVVNKAFAELEAWRSRYAGFFHLIEHEQAGQFLSAIDRLSTQMGDDWPKLPEELFDGSHGDR